MNASIRCQTVVLSGGNFDVVPVRAAFLTNSRHSPFAKHAPHGRPLWVFGVGANGGVRCHLAY